MQSRTETPLFSAALELLRCPRCGGGLRHERDSLVCTLDASHVAPLVGGIPRFVPYAPEYSAHWDEVEGSASELKLEHGRRFMNWLRQDEPAQGEGARQVFLDVGCGDGNHIPYMPAEALKIVLDYSSAIDIVAQRYRDVPNLVLLQADANNLPLRDGCVDVALSYGCLNCTSDPARGCAEIARTLRSGGLAGLWGYGTPQTTVRLAARVLRRAYRELRARPLQRAMIYSLVPSLLLVSNSTEMRPGRNSLEECLEVVSTNLSAPHLHILGGGKTWADLVPPSLRRLGSDYALPCGQKFVKR